MCFANLRDQLINAAFPLKPLTAWAGGACTVTLAVPQVQSLAGITVESVTVRLTLPTGAVVTQAATAVADSPNWAATFAADNFSTSGFVAEGFVVNIVGKDETGTSRVWIVSKGDLEIRPGDASPSPGGSYVVVKLHDAAPSTPVDGDAYISGGKLYLYDGTAWHAIGGTSVQVDPTLTMQGAAADAKAVGDALRGGFTEWEFSGSGVQSGVTYVVEEYNSESPAYWVFVLKANGSMVDGVTVEEPNPLSLVFEQTDITATRYAFPTTKTSQLTNDGADGVTQYATTGQIPSSYASTPAMDGVGSAGNSAAWARGDHVHPSDTSKLDGAAAYDTWVADAERTYRVDAVVFHGGRLWRCKVDGTSGLVEPGTDGSRWEPVTLASLQSLKQDALSSEQIGYINAVPSKADKVSGATDGNLASLNAQGNLLDSGAKPSDFAAKSDLPYRLVTPGEWEFSGLPSGATNVGMSFDEEGTVWTLSFTIDGDTQEVSAQAPFTALSVAFTVHEEVSYIVTATRASLPGHLLDRANNLIDATSGNVTLTLPEYQAGKLRDLLVYVDLGDDGTDPYSVTFNFPSGESSTGFKAEGDDPTSATFPAPTAAGEWWYSFTECKPHKFAVSLKQLQDAPQAQGGA